MKRQSIDIIILRRTNTQFFNGTITLFFFFCIFCYPPSSAISFCVRTVYTVVPLWLTQPCYLLKGWHCLGLITGLELRVLSKGFVFPSRSCSREFVDRLWHDLFFHCGYEGDWAGNFPKILSI